MFTAGTDTTTSTLEWAMAELLRNPKVMKTVQSELRSTIGLNKKLEDKDIENLPYLKAVIRETLRLHPPLPFLVPHMAMNPCKMLGYYIPKETTILVNCGPLEGIQRLGMTLWFSSQKGSWNQTWWITKVVILSSYHLVLAVECALPCRSLLVYFLWLLDRSCFHLIGFCRLVSSQRIWT